LDRSRKDVRNQIIQHMSEETTTEEPVLPETQDEPTAPDVNIGDFRAMLQIIDVASQRGAFKGEELTSVGTVRDRLNAFVQYHTPQPEEEAPAESDEASA
jgi:hypothetical protein